MKKTKRLKRFNPKAWIGFLVGYDSSNVYRIWNPQTGQVISTRDVIFDEQETFSGNKDELVQALCDDVRDMSLNEITSLLDHIDEGNSNTEVQQDDDLEEGTQFRDDEIYQAPPYMPEYLSEEMFTELEGLDQAAKTPAYLTPPATPPAALLSAAIHKDNDDDGECWSYSTAFAPWKAAFAAGRKHQQVGKIGSNLVDCATVECLMRGRARALQSLHRSVLPKPPSCHEELDEHPCGELFRAAEEEHLQSHLMMNSWAEID